MTLPELDGTWTWVWKEPPEPVRFCHGLIVRAANGNGVTDPQGFNFRRNYSNWRLAFPGPLIAWTYLYNTSDPVEAARVLADVSAVAYIIDWEDAAGPAPSGLKLQRTVDELRMWRPSIPIGFSSYPTKAQAQAHGVDWDAGIASCDFVAPQTYYNYQVADYGQVIADAKGRQVQLDLEPGAASGWHDLAQRHLGKGQGVSFWRLGTQGSAVRELIRELEEANDVTDADIQRAVRAVLHLEDSLAVPKGQLHNDKLAQMLVGGSQSQHNAIVALASAVNGNTAALLEIKAQLDTLAARQGPAPAGGRVSGTFTATLGGEATT